MVMGVHAITAGLTILDIHPWEGEIVARTLTAGTAPTAEEAVGHPKYNMGVHCAQINQEMENMAENRGWETECEPEQS